MVANVPMETCRKCDYLSGGCCEYSRITGMTKALASRHQKPVQNGKCSFFHAKGSSRHNDICITAKKVRNKTFRITNKADGTLFFEGKVAECAEATGHTTAYIRNLANGAMTSSKFRVEVV